MTLTGREVFEIHRLRNEGASIPAIARYLGLSAPTVYKYLRDPDRWKQRTERNRSSKLDPFNNAVKQMLDQRPDVSAVVVYQRLVEQGYEGGLTIVKDHLRSVRGKRKAKKTFWHFESLPGEQMQIDWSACGTVTYGRHKRPLHCFAMVEGYSRMLFVTFTHSMKLEVFIDCHVEAFRFYGGCARKILHDNLKTAVVERDGRLIRFNETYLDFLLRIRAVPHACTPGAPHEKGKIENAIGYVKNNFLPLRTFKDLEDVNRQARLWLDQVANVRIHQTTGEKPIERFKRVTLQPVDALDGYDSREMMLTKGPQDLRINFDCNRYSIPFWAAGKTLTIKASRHKVTVYLKQKVVARHDRCWGKYQSVVNPLHRDGMTSGKQQSKLSYLQEILVSMGEPAPLYIERLQQTAVPIKRSLQKLAELRDSFGSALVLKAMALALERNVPGVEYVEQLALQLSRPNEKMPRLQLKNRSDLSQLRLSDIDLVVYDNVLYKKGHSNDE